MDVPLHDLCTALREGTERRMIRWARGSVYVDDPRYGRMYPFTAVVRPFYVMLHVAPHVIEGNKLSDDACLGIVISPPAYHNAFARSTHPDVPMWPANEQPLDPVVELHCFMKDYRAVGPEVAQDDAYASRLQALLRACCDMPPE